MKIAIVHDYIKEYGGAERVLEELTKIFPKADIYTSVYLPEYLGPHRKRFEKKQIKTSFLQYLPFKSKLISPFRFISPFVFWLMNFDDYDVVIVSATGAYIPNNIRKGSAKQICYCHTPPRYLYGYETARVIKNNALDFLMHTAFHFLRIFDFYASQNVDLYIANSEEVKSRIWKFYRQKSVVINPAVEIPKIKNTKKQNFYLAGGRLARAKHPELVIKAAIKQGFELKLFGKSFAGYGKYLQELAKNHDNIKILGEISEKQKWELLSQAKAYISPSKDEDFGILNVEAMAAGTPVIAHASGGTLETVVDKKTGILFEKLNTKSLIDAVKLFEKSRIKSSDCKLQAKEFSSQKFDQKIKKLINNQ